MCTHYVRNMFENDLLKIATDLLLIDPKETKEIIANMKDKFPGDDNILYLERVINSMQYFSTRYANRGFDQPPVFVIQGDKLDLSKVAEIKELIANDRSMNFTPKETNNNNVLFLSNENITFNEIIDILEKNIDSNKLILVDPNVRQIGKTTAIVKIAHKNKIPIITGARNGDYIISSITKKLEIDPSEIEVFLSVDEMVKHSKLNPFNGFLVDEGAVLEKLKSRKVDIKPLTGFFTNYYF